MYNTLIHLEKFMSIGIYALVFPGTEKIYIGKSNNISNRYKSHVGSFKNGKANPDLLEAFNTFGQPEQIVLEECTLAELDEREIFYIKEYDSFRNGFNRTAGGTTHHTPHSTNKFSSGKVPDEKIEEVFFLLLDTSNKIKDISGVTGVSITVVRDIARLASHAWLAEKYPEEYSVLTSIKESKIRLSRANASHNSTHAIPQELKDLVATMLDSGFTAKEIHSELDNKVSLSWIQKFSSKR
jgi:group I intron endonuclease